MPPAFIEHSLGAKRVYNIIMAYQVGPTYHSPVANGRTDTTMSEHPLRGHLPLTVDFYYYEV